MIGRRRAYLDGASIAQAAESSTEPRHQVHDPGDGPVHELSEGEAVAVLAEARAGLLLLLLRGVGSRQGVVIQLASWDGRLRVGEALTLAWRGVADTVGVAAAAEGPAKGKQQPWW